MALLRAGLAALLALAALASGCLDRPLSTAPPITTNVFVQDIQQSSVEQLDLLFMIDNSMSMADKQETLGQAVPELVRRLLTPERDPVTGKQEFEPLGDVHIGVVTSSLGGHGGDQCSEGGLNWNPTQNDRAHLVGTTRAGLESYSSMGFLWWDAGGTHATPAGESDQTALEAAFAEHVTAAGERGCGYEASLEAWYRFLIDPEPPLDVVSDGQTASRQGVDEVVLQQRADFLRPTSIVAVIMLTDENDCSIIDGGRNWMAAQIVNPDKTAFHLPRGTSACAGDPNSVCCRSCGSDESSPPEGCGDIASDSECKKGVYDDDADPPNLRCYRAKQRFGIDFLYPTRKYVEALTQPTICPSWDASGPLCSADQRVPNPLFAESSWGGRPSRDPNLVYLVGIVGVPWQDIATDETLDDPAKLKYLNPQAIDWDWLVPKCARFANTDELPRPIGSLCNQWDLTDEPDDPLMIESSEPRSGVHPRNSAWSVQPPNAGELANPINGHEWLTSGADLQYACIFKRATPKDCTNVALGCDCDDVGIGYPANNPLCQGGGTYTKTQTYAKAFPGQRELEVLKDFGINSIVASICPKVTDPSSTSYGYNPAIEAIVERLRPTTDRQCINRPVAIQIGPTGEPVVQCALVEVLQSASSGCRACDSNINRFDLKTGTPELPESAKLIGPLLKRLGDKAVCGPNSATQVSCTAENFCMCGLGFAMDQDDCLNSVEPSGKNYGWCYVDPVAGFGTNPAVVEDCTPHRLLRFVGNNTPANGSIVFMACQGKQLVSQG